MKKNKRVGVRKSQQLDLFSKQRRSRRVEPRAGSSKRVSIPRSQQLDLFSKQRRSSRVEPRAESSKRDPCVPPTRKSSRVPHETRPEVNGPLHVVLRIRRGLPGLRTPRALRRLERAFRAGKEKLGFGLVHYSVQQDHVHLVVEAQSKQMLARGMQGLNIRLAKTLNSLWGRRKGSVFADRYFALALSGIRQIWRTVRYVLLNGRKHGTWTKRCTPDPFSSGRWFRPWRIALDSCRATRRAAVVEVGSPDWMPYIDIDHVPGPRGYALTS